MPSFSLTRSVSFEDKDVRLMMGTGDMRMRKMQVTSLSVSIYLLISVSLNPKLSFYYFLCLSILSLFGFSLYH